MPDNPMVKDTNPRLTWEQYQALTKTYMHRQQFDKTVLGYVVAAARKCHLSASVEEQLEHAAAQCLRDMSQADVAELYDGGYDIREADVPPQYRDHAEEWREEDRRGEISNYPCY